MKNVYFDSFCKYNSIDDDENMAENAGYFGLYPCYIASLTPINLLDCNEEATDWRFDTAIMHIQPYIENIVNYIASIIPFIVDGSDDSDHSCNKYLDYAGAYDDYNNLRKSYETAINNIISEAIHTYLPDRLLYLHNVYTNHSYIDVYISIVRYVLDAIYYIDYCYIESLAA